MSWSMVGVWKNIDDEITFFVELKWKCCLQLWWVADKRMMSWKTAKQGHVTMSDEDKKTYSSLVFILSCLLVVKNCNYYKKLLLNNLKKVFFKLNIIQLLGSRQTLNLCLQATKCFHLTFCIKFIFTNMQ